MTDESPSAQIDTIIASHDGWKAGILRQLRTVILAADDRIVEEVKWKMPSRPLGLPVWSCAGIVCFAEIWKDNVKLLFPHGADLPDSQQQFNARLESKDIRAIAFVEGSAVDTAAVQALVRAAVAHNTHK